MLLPASCERVATSLNGTVSGDTFPILSSLDNPVDGATFTEAYAMLKEVYGNEYLSRTQVFEWFKLFKEGRKTTEDDSRPERPLTSKTDKNIEKIGKLIREDCRLIIRRLPEIIGIDKECVRQILHESKLLTPEKESRVKICADILNNIDTDPGLLDMAITCDDKILIVWKRLEQKRRMF
ncbi:hypothetical protein NQ318_019385 [Aromia moschata]|uniref:Mos1 transposase HTH domain-containing protein n=1 Tax=Aromia moschata TaxID=1265417 RepID=A0AAV8XMK4_9CUCU|nr:hypothetical protein NQ318_019385 [Aromia moschata]